MRNDEVAVDFRGKISLGFRKQDHTHYRGSEAPDGTITLVPLVRVPAYKVAPEPSEPEPEMA